MPVQECQKRISSEEFILWMEYLKKDINAFHREDYYLAQIAAEVRRFISKNPEKVKVEDFILKFGEKKIEPKVQKMTLEERTLAAKRYWLGIVGIKNVPKS